MSKPSKPSEMHGGAPLTNRSSERTPSCALPDYQTTSTEFFELAGEQFKRKHPGKHDEERLVCRLETVTSVPHEDLIL